MEVEMEENKLLIKSQVSEDTILTLFDNIKLLIPSSLSVEVSKNTIRIISPNEYNLNLNEEEWNVCGDVEPKQHNMLSSFYVCPTIKDNNFNSFYPLHLNLNEEELNQSDSESDLLEENI
jgi:hypothetical protein